MSIEKATEYLKMFYPSVVGDEVVLRDIFTFAGLNLSEEKKNKVWLGNKLSPMKKHGLVTPMYKNGYLVGVRLTELGKRILGRTNGNSSLSASNSPEIKNNHGEITLEEILRVIPKLRQENPEFKITFSVTPKEE